MFSFFLSFILFLFRFRLEIQQSWRCLDLVSKLWSLNFGFPSVFGGARGFRKIREAKRKNSLELSSKMHVMVPSYDQKSKKFTTVNFTTIKVGACTVYMQFFILFFVMFSWYMCCTCLFMFYVFFPQFSSLFESPKTVLQNLLKAPENPPKSHPPNPPNIPKNSI